MLLYNSLTKKVEEFTPVESQITIYSCGPTVYDNLHIGNLASFIYADTLRRVVGHSFSDLTLHHVMNITDVDDKTINNSNAIGSSDPNAELQRFTAKYEKVFMEDIKNVGIDLGSMTFIRATDSIGQMQKLISELHGAGVAYTTEDGVYFSIDEYRKLGKTYGQLVHIDANNTSHSRIDNDEYEKESAHDFALWKKARPGEPKWDFDIGGKNLAGRPGWHIECSAMSRQLLGQPFDIHTGGIDLKFPHHENEIAQSTAGSGGEVYARCFVHNEHILVEGKKMSKSLGNFYTLRDVEDHGFSPIAFRLLVLQSHYRNPANFSWDNLESASNRLHHWRSAACKRWQHSELNQTVKTASIIGALQKDLDTPTALQQVDEQIDSVSNATFFETIDQLLGLGLITSTPDIPDEAKELIKFRAKARSDKDWSQSDTLRDQLVNEFNVTINDTSSGQYWSYIKYPS